MKNTQLILVEDDKKVKETIKNMFQNSDYSIKVAEDQKEAEELYNENDNGLILNRLSK